MFSTLTRRGRANARRFASAQRAYDLALPPCEREGPYCVRCGSPEVMTDRGDHETGPTFECPGCAAREERHRARGRFLTRRTRARGESRRAEAFRLRGGYRTAPAHPVVRGVYPDGAPFYRVCLTDSGLETYTRSAERAGVRLLRVDLARASRLPDSHPAVPEPEYDLPF
jgi:hypothetical protein